MNPTQNKKEEPLVKINFNIVPAASPKVNGRNISEHLKKVRDRFTGNVERAKKEGYYNKWMPSVKDRSVQKNVDENGFVKNEVCEKGERGTGGSGFVFSPDVTFNRQTQKREVAKTKRFSNKGN